MVLSGGGPTGLIMYGAIKRLHEEGFWSRNELETIYATSIGGFIGIIIALGYDWDINEEYLVRRPWTKAFSNLSNDILEIISNKGVDGIEMATICTEPLLSGKNLPKNITLQALYDYTKVELCFIATELNTANGLHTEILSHKTYPDMTLITALASTCAFPLMFKPVLYNDKCFVDGGLLNNFPLNICLKETNCKHEETLAFCNYVDQTPMPQITETSSLIEYTRILMRKCYLELETTRHQPKIENTLQYATHDVVDYSVWLQALEDENMRKTLIERGKQAAETFISSKQNQEIVAKYPAAV